MDIRRRSYMSYADATFSLRADAQLKADGHCQGRSERRRPWDYGPGLWGCCFGGPWRRPSRREKTEALKGYIAELKEALQDAEERLKDLESNARRGCPRTASHKKTASSLRGRRAR